MIAPPTLQRQPVHIDTLFVLICRLFVFIAGALVALVVVGEGSVGGWI